MSTTPNKAPPMSAVTPTKRVALGAGAEAGPSRIRPQAASPAYSSRKHSLYGIDDRVVIDPGSRVWKVGFSGETEPRSVFWGNDEGEAWDLDLQATSGARGNREEGRRIVEANVLRRSRETYIKHLLTDAKTRQVIVLENTFLPTHVKEAIAQALFNNLRVPSIAFTPSSLLALAACGRITGLVVDCGWLETTITPVYHSRPLVNLARSTPLGGRALNRFLRSLLGRYAVYVPPSTNTTTDRGQRETPGPPDRLSDRVVEQVLTKGCFVGGLPDPRQSEHDGMDVDVADEYEEDHREARLMSEMKRRYGTSLSPARSFRIPHSATARDGQGTLVVPGWILERTAELLFDSDLSEEAESIPEAVLDTVLNLPVDLRHSIISSIVVVGGTSSLPNFIPRLRQSLLQSLLPPPTSHSPSEAISLAAWKQRHTEPYRELYPLSAKLAISNDPRPHESEGTAKGGSAPRWVPSLMTWVGGSLAGALKTGGPELLREHYDGLASEAMARGEQYRAALDDAESEAHVAATVGIDVTDLQPGMALTGNGRKRGWRDGVTLDDWTKLGGVRV